MDMSIFDILKTAKMPVGKKIHKLGTVKINAVESTPVVWEGRLLRFEWVRNAAWSAAGGITRKHGYYCFVDMETEEVVAEVGEDNAFGSCYAEGGKMYVHGVRGEGGGNVLETFVSSDLVHWEKHVGLTLSEELGIYNTSVCRGERGYVMAVEVDGKHPCVGNPYTCIFATSEDLIHWELLDPMEYCYTRERYSACPCIRYVDGYYYVIYLEMIPWHHFVPYIVRSRDLKKFEMAVKNPVMWYDDDDKKVIRPERFTAEELDYIQNAVDTNNSDFDMCEYNGKTVITYSWGNQWGKEFLALAEYDGPNDEFLRSFFLD